MQRSEAGEPGKNSKTTKRAAEITELYRRLGIESQEVRKYLLSLGSMGAIGRKETPIIFIELAATSEGAGEVDNA